MESTAILSGFVVWLGGLTMLMFRMWLQERRRSSSNPNSPYPLCSSHSEKLTEIGEKVAVLWEDRNKEK